MKVFAKAREKRGEIYIYDTIGKDFFSGGVGAQDVADALKEFEKGSALDIFINSPGGSAFDGIAIYNQLRRWEGKKDVHIDGVALSAASIIAMAGDTIRIADNGTIMIHDPWGFTVGNASEMRKTADSLDIVAKAIATTYVSRTGNSEADVEKWMHDETWMDADEAVKRGFATVKVEQKAVKAEFEMLAKFRNTPKDMLARATDTRVRIARMDMRVAALNRGSPARATG